MTLIFFLIYTIVLIIGFALAGFWFWRRYARREGEIARSLGMAVFSVLLPKISPQEAENLSSVDRVRERIAVMEQLYRSFREIHDSWWHEFIYGEPVFSLELTVPEIGAEVLFYVAVPNHFADAAQKIIQGLYPDGIVERTRDYNVFNPFGQSVGCTITAENQYLPLQTYQTLEADPLRLIVGAFSNIAEEGEGAAVQIVARPAEKSWSRQTAHIADLLRGGKSLSSAIKETVGSGNNIFFGIFYEIFRETSKKSTAEEKPQNSEPQNQALLQLIDRKASKPLFEATIRIIASAKTGERAQELARSLVAPFQAFTVPTVNEIKIITEQGVALRDFLYRFSFRLLSKKRVLILSSEELATFYHFPNTPQDSPKIKVLKSHDAPAPIEMPKVGLLLGKNMYRGQEIDVRITDDDRRRHLYIIGQTGVGKSVFLKEMLRQDILSGKGICFIDPHGDAAEEILSFIPASRAEDLIYFNPGDTARPLGLNMLEYDSKYPEQKTFIVNELLDIFNKLYDMSIAGGPMFEQYFRNATNLVMDDPASGNTLLEISRVLTDKSFRDLKLSRTTNPLVKQFWIQIAEKAGGEASLQNMVPYISSKFDTFLSNEIMRPIIAQEKSAFSFREVMDTNKILIINLSKGRLGELNSSLIGLIMVGKLLMAAFSRADLPDIKRKDFYLYIDEFQNVTTKSIATILSEARKYRLDLIITHQFIGQLEEEIKKAVFGNVGSMASFRIGVDDTEVMAKQFAPVFTADDLLNLDNFHAYAKLLINGQTSRPFSFVTVTPSKGNKEIVPMLKEYSRLRYGADREAVEAHIAARYASTPYSSPMG